MPTETDTPKSGSSFDGIGQLFKEFGGLIASIAGFATAVGIVWQSGSDFQRWAVIGIAGLVLLYAIIAQVVSPWIARRRRQRVIDLVETGEAQRREVFRLRPYEERDHDDFDRPDGAHERAFDWLNESDAPCLYLTGFSGTGKSSLLQAWLIPELAEADRPVRTVVVRSFADPIGQLVAALKADGAVPIDLPAEETDPLPLLALAADAMVARNGRLLIAIDQFEECLILQDEATKDRLGELFAKLKKNPIEGLQLLFVMRTDYLKFDELTALCLPDPRPRENWFNLEALSHADARNILRQALPGMDPSLENQVIEEASDVDDLPGLIRPITLNMLGLILKSFAGAALTRTAPGRLIQDFLRNAIEKPGIERAAPKLLAEMITDKGTKKPMAEAALAGTTGIDPAMTRKTLYLLGEEGVVRELDREQTIWEISHDFVARQLGQIIPRLKPSWWQQAQKAATPVALVAWLVILGAGYPIYQVWESAEIADDLRALGVRVHGEKGAYDVTVDNRTNAEAIDRIIIHLNKLQPTSLSIQSNQLLLALPSLDGLTALANLSIYGNIKLQTLRSLDGLIALTNLSIVNNTQLQELPSLDGLTALTSLTISRNTQLQALPSLEGLTALTALTISDNDRLQALPLLDSLNDLTSLKITDNAALLALPPLDGLQTLASLWVWNNSQLQALPSLDGLTALTSLSIGDNVRLPSLDGLTALTELAIIDNDQLQVLPSLDGLTDLVIRNGDQLQMLPSLDGLAGLKKLTISGNDRLLTLPVFDGLASLTRLSIDDNDQLKALPGLDGLTALTSLSIHNNAQLQELPSLDGLIDLTSLSISNNGKLRELPSLDSLTNLTSLSIRYNEQLQTLPSLAANANLKSVRISNNDQISGLPELGDLGRLKAIGFDAGDIEATIEALKGLPATITIETTRSDIGAFSKQLNQARTKLDLQPAEVMRWWGADQTE